MENINSVEIGNRIKNQRQLLGLTRDELAEKVDITPRFCYDIELGLKNPSLNTLSKISKSLNLTMDYIIKGDSTNSSDMDTILSLCSFCPESKIPYLKAIISQFIQSTNKE